jgi:hypothetical protein
MKDLLEKERETLEALIYECVELIGGDEFDIRSRYAERRDEKKRHQIMKDWLTAHDHRILTALKEAIEGKKYGKHNSDCEHDINWCVTHGEELMDCDFEQYGHNVGIDEALKTINSIEATQSPESSSTDV